MFNWAKKVDASMRLTTLCGLFLTISACSSVSNIRPDAITPNFQSRLNVMSFNIRRGCGWEEWGASDSSFLMGCTKHYDEIIAAIKSTDPDVVGLQEVSGGQAGKIAKALNMNYVQSNHNPSGYGSRWGNAVLSKFKILESQTIGIGGSVGRNRSMVSATAVVNDMPIAFASVHTDHRLYDSSSVNRILRYVESHSMPIVLIGDFNMTSYDPTISLLKESAGFVDSAFEEVKRGRMLGTYGSPQAERIDYVFIQSEHFNVLEAALVTEEHHRASDHLAYYTVIEWK